mgnify:CR=1 FL=1
MELIDGIKETAQALGMTPVDLATLISYETAGTFDPSQRGPTTQHGQHRGLIQFGEPQAARFGVDWNNPAGSQLGRDGAIVKYMLASGFEPGMSLLDAYSTINAGAPGRYNASDANNGGAPGSVRDKVNNQMAGHRENAVRLLGEAASQPVAQPSYAPTNALAQIAQPEPQNALTQPAYQPTYQGLDPRNFMSQPNRLAQMSYDNTNPFLRALS